MNNTTKRAYFLIAVIAAFLAGVAIMVFTFYTHGDEWAGKRVNAHVYSYGILTNAGSICDRNGTELVYSKDNERLYSDDEIIRKATLHTVGDTEGFISTGAQRLFSSKLSGYDFVNGVYYLKKYNKGNDIYLTLDADVCRQAYEVFDGRKGTIGIYNYRTGEIICMMSSPSFDPENKPEDIESDDYYNGVYLNRLLSGQYTPGSVFKIVTAVSAIENISGVEERSFDCDGSLNVSDGEIICNDVHGEINFEQALNRSCNCVFSELAIELGKNKIQKTAEELGFNKCFKIGSIELSESTMEVKDASEVDLGWAGIGQYTTKVNPLHILTLMGTIANGGTTVQPYFADYMLTPAGTRKNIDAKADIQIKMSPETAEKMKAYLRSDVVNYYSDDFFPGLSMCGKTGTAEVDNKESHSWFAGFSLSEENPYAVVCIVENSGSGLEVAGNAVNCVMQYVFNN